MQGYNIIVVCDQACGNILMCKRRKEPYKGLFNLVGGKIENGEESEQAAYRELFEETNISRDDITLVHLMDFTYYSSQYYLEAYVGKLNKAVSVSGDENELHWVDINSDFYDMKKFAGEGNIGHIVANMKTALAAMR